MATCGPARTNMVRPVSVKRNRHHPSSIRSTNDNWRYLLPSAQAVELVNSQESRAATGKLHLRNLVIRI